MADQFLICISSSDYLYIYRISKNIDSDLIWRFGESCRDHQINCTPLSSLIYCKHAFPYSTEIHQFKIPPIVLVIWANHQIFYSPITPLIHYKMESLTYVHSYIVMICSIHHCRVLLVVNWNHQLDLRMLWNLSPDTMLQRRYVCSDIRTMW